MLLFPGEEALRPAQRLLQRGDGGLPAHGERLPHGPGKALAGELGHIRDASGRQYAQDAAAVLFHVDKLHGDISFCVSGEQILYQMKGL